MTLYSSLREVSASGTPYLYETHMHTCQGSACGRSSGAEQARFYRQAGYTGIIITDHFFSGNTAVDRKLPWEERIDLFFAGYEEAKQEGDRIGLDVFFAYEQNFAGDEYLVYGLDKAFMKAHPEMEHWTRREQLDEVHRAGGCVIQAHPFRMRGYMDRIRLGIRYCDGIEVANAGNEPIDDARAMLLGQEKHLLMTAGTDNHLSPRETVYGVCLREKLTDIRDYVRLILHREEIGLYVPAERFGWPESWEADDRHRAFELDEKEQDLPAKKEWTPWDGTAD